MTVMILISSIFRYKNSCSFVINVITPFSALESNIAGPSTNNIMKTSWTSMKFMRSYALSLNPNARGDIQNTHVVKAKSNDAIKRELDFIFGSASNSSPLAFVCNFFVEPSGVARGFLSFRPFLEHIWRNLFELRHLLWRMDIRREFQAVPVRVKEIDGLEDAMMCRAEHLYISRFEAFLRGE